MPDLMEAVPSLLREAAALHVLPVFGRRAAAPEEKAPGEWVTVADRTAESFLTPRLAALIPGSVVVGEEAASADLAVLDHLAAHDDVWLLDPLDGTANFAAGTGPFALMAALLRNGETVASWILDPLSGRLACAQQGAGAWLDAQRFTTDCAAVSATDHTGTTDRVSALSGAVLSRFLPESLAAHIAVARHRFAAVTAGTGCAGADYPAVAAGATDFVLYWRTLPWDHAPGVLFLQEAGGVAQRPDGSPYRPGQHARPGLLVAGNPITWDLVRATLLPDTVG